MAVTLGEAQHPVVGLVYIDIDLGLSSGLGPESFESVTKGFLQVAEVTSCYSKYLANGTFTLRLSTNTLSDDLRRRLLECGERLVRTVA